MFCNIKMSKYSLTQKGAQYTESIQDDSFVKQHRLVFKPKGFNELGEIKLLNEILDYSLDLDKMSMTLIYLYTTDDIFQYLVNEKIEVFAKESLPQKSGHKRKNDKCYIEAWNMVMDNDICELFPSEIFLKKIGKSCAIIFNPTAFINFYIDILRKHIINKVVHFLKDSNPTFVDKLYIEESDSFVSVNYKLKKNLKVTLFKCKINHYVPHISLKYINEYALTDNGILEIVRHDKLGRVFKKFKINLFNGDFLLS